MRHFSVKKVAIGVAAACFLVSGMAFAGKTAGFISSTDIAGYAEYDSFDKVAEAEKKLGYEVDCVEQFGNGYAFVNANVHEVDAVDENGNKTYTIKQLMIEYNKEGEPYISLHIEKPVEDLEDTKAPDAVRECDGITVEYDLYTYKFVPTDYELTEEDLANQERDDYFISVGSDEVEIMQNQSVTWEKDGISYHLLGFDTSMSAEEMLDMAEEVIRAQ